MTAPLASYLHRFDDSVNGLPIPRLFTYPFCYEPHPLCVEAAKQVQKTLAEHQWLERHYQTQPQGEYAGKMFGVLVVQTPEKELGYLTGFSGKLAGSNHYEGFVPPVYDILAHDNIFIHESQQINALNQKITNFEDTEKFRYLRDELARNQAQAQSEIAAQQLQMANAKKQRKARRAELSNLTTREEQDHLLTELAKQSIEGKRRLASLKKKWQHKITQCADALNQHEQTLDALKFERKSRSQRLQRELFSNYIFLNARGEQAVLIELFKHTFTPIPPAGSGECAAPKLLQFAYQHRLTPIAMAEFWWGHSPKSTIRQHKRFYPSCQSKCLPILTHMLKGLEVEPNPLLTAPVVTKDIDIIYQDDAIVIVNKPAEMLSVPGVHVQDSAFTRLKSLLGPRKEGPYVLHRLDMSTSGLLIFALTKRANKNLQRQFINRQIEKRYLAELEGKIDGDSGYIHLPIAPDMDDKPRQMICEKRGKPALTYWEKISHNESRTRLYLYPKTGRTHQLRVHCAHYQGLNAPIVGDDLYGNKDSRLHLHAESLRFTHPYTRETLAFHVDSDF